MSDSSTLSRTEEATKHLALVLLVPSVSGTQEDSGVRRDLHFSFHRELL